RGLARKADHFGQELPILFPRVFQNTQLADFHAGNDGLDDRAHDLRHAAAHLQRPRLVERRLEHVCDIAEAGEAAVSIAVGAGKLNPRGRGQAKPPPVRDLASDFSMAFSCNSRLASTTPMSVSRMQSPAVMRPSGVTSRKWMPGYGLMMSFSRWRAMS